VEFKAALVKGRSNYACLRKLEHAEAEPALFPDESTAELTSIIEWSKACQDGCRSDLSFTPRGSTWEEVCCEADQCSRSKCKHFNRCFFYRARRDSSAARILVVNHALLLSDIVLRRRPATTPRHPAPFTRLIFDEGHHLEDVATSHLSLVISRGAILKQLQRLVPPKANRAGLLTIISSRLTRDLPESMEALYTELSALLESHLLPKAHDVAHLTEQAMDWLALAVERESGAREGVNASCVSRPRCSAGPFGRNAASGCRPWPMPWETIPRPCGRWCAAVETCLTSSRKTGRPTAGYGGIEGRLQAMADGLLFFITEPEGYCRWMETSSGHRGVQARLCAAPLDISHQVRETILDRLKTIIVTSATLTVGGDFKYLKKRTGFGLLPRTG